MPALVTRLFAAVALAVTTLLAGLWITTAPAYACSCAQPDPSASVSRADVIFRGTITQDETRGSLRRITFTVDRVFKGTAKAVQLVETQSSGSSCGLEIGGVGTGPYVVFAQAGGGRTELTADLCGGTGNAPAPATLGPGQPPTPVDPAGSARTRRYGFIAIGVLCIGAAIYFSRRPPGFDLPRLGTKR